MHVQFRVLKRPKGSRQFTPTLPTDFGCEHCPTDSIFVVSLCQSRALFGDVRQSAVDVDVPPARNSNAVRSAQQFLNGFGLGFELVRVCLLETVKVLNFPGDSRQVTRLRKSDQLEVRLS